MQKRSHNDQSVIELSSALVKRFQSVSICLFLMCLSPSIVSAVSNELTAVDERSVPHVNAAYYAELPTINAQLKKYNERYAERVSTYWVQLSPMGMRVQDIEGKTEVIKNFEEQRVWLTNSKSKTRLEIDIDFYREYFPDQVKYLTGAASISNVSGTVPCADLSGTKVGTRSWRGQIVDEWSCLSDGGVPVSTQLYSQRWKIIVQVKHADLNVEELVDIQEEFQTVNTYRPNDSLQNVDFTEFMTGTQQLDSYSP